MGFDVPSLSVRDNHACCSVSGARQRGLHQDHVGAGVTFHEETILFMQTRSRVRNYLLPLSRLDLRNSRVLAMLEG